MRKLINLVKKHTIPPIPKSDLYMEGRLVTPKVDSHINGSNFTSEVIDNDGDIYDDFTDFDPTVEEDFTFLNDDDLDEIEEAINTENILTPILPTQPEPETPERYLKDWFNRLCGSNTISKYIQNNDYYYFADDIHREFYPQLYYTTVENVRCYLKYKEFTIDLTSEESLKLSRIFKKGLNDYYLNIFKSKVREIDMPERSERNGRRYGTWL